MLFIKRSVFHALQISSFASEKAKLQMGPNFINFLEAKFTCFKSLKMYFTKLQKKLAVCRILLFYHTKRQLNFVKYSKSDRHKKYLQKQNNYFVKSRIGFSKPIVIKD